MKQSSEAWRHLNFQDEIYIIELIVVSRIVNKNG
jgi:hypothetical protein